MTAPAIGTIIEADGRLYRIVEIDENGAVQGTPLVSVEAVSRYAVNLTDGRTVGWDSMEPGHGPDRDERRARLRQAREKLRSLPLSQQGIYVEVREGAGNQLYVAVSDASGDYRRELMRADEGCTMSRFHVEIAEAEAAEIRARLRERGVIENAQ